MQPLSSGHTHLLNSGSRTVSQAHVSSWLLPIHVQAASSHTQNHCHFSIVVTFGSTWLARSPAAANPPPHARVSGASSRMGAVGAARLGRSGKQTQNCSRASDLHLDRRDRRGMRPRLPSE